VAEQLIKVPNVGDAKAVEVIEVLVKPGDMVSLDQSLITLESDKASMEIPSPAAGKVLSLQVKTGDKVNEGAPILTLEIGAEAAAEPAGPAPAAAQPAAVAAAPAPQAVAPAPAAVPAPTPAPAVSSTSGEGPSHASPAVRRFARELGADIGQIRGTGPKGRILKEDVQNYIKACLQQPAGSGLSLPPVPSIDFSAFGPVDTQPLSRIQKLSGQYLLRAWQSIPHVTHHDEADITELEAFRVSLKDDAAKRGVKLTLLPFIMQALVAALKAFPQFNASLDGDNLVLKRYYHIGMAVDTEDGLVVPVLRDADRLKTLELAAAAADLSERARNRRLKREEIEGGTCTISSLGGVGGRFFTPIINAPEVAILGLCRTQLTPVYRNGQLEQRLLLPLSLSYDHRVIDGAVAARFTNHLKASLGDIRRLLI
jgi:pyruvate dehydrogenase E2 component (dihydrolipoamide acetyltransferase)